MHVYNVCYIIFRSICMFAIFGILSFRGSCMFAMCVILSFRSICMFAMFVILSLEVFAHPTSLFYTGPPRHWGKMSERKSVNDHLKRWFGAASVYVTYLPTIIVCSIWNSCLLMYSPSQFNSSPSISIYLNLSQSISIWNNCPAEFEIAAWCTLQFSLSHLSNHLYSIWNSCLLRHRCTLHLNPF